MQIIINGIPYQEVPVSEATYFYPKEEYRFCVGESVKKDINLLSDYVILPRSSLFKRKSDSGTFTKRYYHFLIPANIEAPTKEDIKKHLQL